MSHRYFRGYLSWHLTGSDPYPGTGKITTSCDSAREDLQERMNMWDSQQSIRIPLGSNAEKKCQIWPMDNLMYRTNNWANTHDNHPQFFSSLNGMKLLNDDIEMYYDDEKEFRTSEDLERAIQFLGVAWQKHSTTKEIHPFDLSRHFSKVVMGPVTVKNLCHPGIKCLWDKYPEIMTKKEFYSDPRYAEYVQKQSEATYAGEIVETYIDYFDVDSEGGKDSLYNILNDTYWDIYQHTLPSEMRETHRIIARTREAIGMDMIQYGRSKRLRNNHRLMKLLHTELELTNDGKLTRFTGGTRNVRKITTIEHKNLIETARLSEDFVKAYKKKSCTQRQPFYVLSPGPYGGDTSYFVMGDRGSNGNYKTSQKLARL